MFKMIIRMEIYVDPCAVLMYKLIDVAFYSYRIDGDFKRIKHAIRKQHSIQQIERQWMPLHLLSYVSFLRSSFSVRMERNFSNWLILPSNSNSELLPNIAVQLAKKFQRDNQQTCWKEYKWFFCNNCLHIHINDRRENS